MRPTTLIATLALLLGAHTALAQNGHAMNDQTHPAHHRGTIVTVQGEGEVRLTPDRAAVTIGVSAQAKTAEEAQKQVNRAMDRVLRDVKALNLPGELLTTSGISLFPVYENRPRQMGAEAQEPRIIAYRASNTVRVRLDDVARVGEVIDAATAAGSNTIQGVQFMLQDENAAKLDALRDAVAKARTKADTIANAMGRSVETVLEVTEGGIRGPIFPQRGQEMFAARAMMDDAGTPVEAGEIVITAMLSMTVRLAD